MTPDPTPPPAAVEAMDNLLRNTPWLTPQHHDHGAAGFCTDHGQAQDERTETVARVALAERIETAMTDDEHRMPRSDETRYLAYVAAGEVAAVVAALDDESARLREPVRPWCSDPDFDQEFARAMAERDAARAALDRVRALLPATWRVNETPFVFADDLEAALDPEEPR